MAPRATTNSQRNSMDGRIRRLWLPPDPRPSRARRLRGHGHAGIVAPALLPGSAPPFRLRSVENAQLAS